MGEDSSLKVGCDVHIRPNCIGRRRARKRRGMLTKLFAVSVPRGPSQACCGSEHADNDNQHA